MPIGKVCRLEALGFWGTNRKAFSQSLTSDEALRRALRARGLQNIRLYRAGLIDGELVGNDDGDGKAARALGLSYQRLFPQAYNVKLQQWLVQTAGEDQYLLEYANQFDGPGLGYINHNSSSVGPGVVIKSAPCTGYLGTDPVGQGGFPVLRNAGHSLDFFLPKPVDGDKGAAFIARWNGYQCKGWQFRVFNGKAEIMRLRGVTKDASGAVTATGWEQQKEDLLHALMALENPSTAQQAQIDGLEQTIYVDKKTLDFGGDWYNNARSLDFIPEARGVLHISDGARIISVKNSDIIKSRELGTMWPDSTLTLISNGPAFFYRAGFPWFTPAGQIGFGRSNVKPWSGNLPQMEFKSNKDITGAGVNISFANNTTVSTPVGVPGAPTSYSNEVVATLSTAHRRYTPWLYAANSWIPPGERSGSTVEVWDSGDAQFLDAAGVGPILDAVLSIEENGAQKWTVTVRDVKGSTFEGIGYWYESLENRVVNLYLDGEAVLLKGVVKSATLHQISSAEYNQTRDSVTHNWTVVVLEIFDQNAIIDEHLISEDPLGDFETLGQFNRKLLTLPGIPLSQIEISPFMGRQMPFAIPGEDWATRPAKAVALGDYLRKTNEKHGQGGQAQYSDGRWRWFTMPTTVAVIGGVAAEFSSDPARSNRGAYPGRLVVMAPLDSIRDSQDFYDRITVIGGEDENGVPIVRVWDIQRGYSNIGGGQLDKKHIGRVRELIVEDSSLRTVDDVLWVRRSLVRKYGLPPRFLAFESYFHLGLVPGMLVKVDSTLCRVVRVFGASAAKDRMGLVLREVQ